MAAAEIVVRRVAPREPAALRLLQASDEYLASLYPPESTYLESVHALAQPHAAFFGAFTEGQLLGCGAIKRMDDDGLYGEIKRVFVDPQARGRGLAKLIMERIETHAIEEGLTLVRLETGVHQPEALGLYRALGYSLRGPFGAYRDDPLSIFMEKSLGGSRGLAR